MSIIGILGAFYFARFFNFRLLFCLIKADFVKLYCFYRFL